MFHEVDRIFPNSDISVFAAAVSDYKPIKYHPQKIKNQRMYGTFHLKKI